MMKTRVLGLLALLLSVAIPAVADEAQLVTPQLTKPATEAAEGDALHEKYEAAWFRYEQAISELRDKVNAALDAQFEKAADAGNLDLADMWDKKKKAFLDTGTVAWPSDAKAKTDWRKTYPTTEFPDDFSEVIAAAGAGFEKAVATLKEDYESLVKDYTKGRNLARAKALRDELAGLARKPVAPAEQPAMAGKKSGVKEGTRASTTPTPVAEKLGLIGKAEYDPQTQVLAVRYDGSSKAALADFELSAGPGSAFVRDGRVTIQANATITHTVDFESVTLTGSIIVPTNGAKKGAIRFGVTADPKVFAYGNLSVRTPAAWKDLGGLQWDRPTPFRLHFGKPEIVIETQGRQASIPCELLVVGRPVISGADFGVSFTELIISGKVSERIARSLSD